MTPAPSRRRYAAAVRQFAVNILRRGTSVPQVVRAITARYGLTVAASTVRQWHSDDLRRRVQPSAKLPQAARAVRTGRLPPRCGCGTCRTCLGQFHWL